MPDTIFSPPSADKVGVDWRIKIIGYFSPEAFIFHASLDDALDEEIHRDSYCEGCGKSSSECPEYCPEYEEWFWTTGRYLVGLADD